MSDWQSKIFLVTEKKKKKKRHHKERKNERNIRKYREQEKKKSSFVLFDSIFSFPFFPFLMFPFVLFLTFSSEIDEWRTISSFIEWTHTNNCVADGLEILSLIVDPYSKKHQESARKSAENAKKIVKTT